MSPCTRIAFAAGLLCTGLCAGLSSAQVIQWNGSISGNWNDPTRWIPQTVPNSATHTAIFNPGMYNPRLNISVAIDSVSVGNGVQLDIQAGTSLGIAGSSFSNNGHMYINPTSASAGTNILVSGIPTTTVSGTGRISLNASPNLATATLNSGAGSTLVNSAGHTIEGSGRILATTHNDGLIRANLFEKYLQISAPVTQSATGTFLAAGGFAGIADGGSLTGGTFTCSDGGKGRIDGNGTIDGVTATPQCTIEVNPGGILHLAAGGITNNGFIVVNQTALNAITTLRFDTAATLNGSGRVVLNANTNINTAVIDSLAAAVGTNGQSHTIAGTGRINAPLINLGTIQADALGRVLEIRSSVTQSGTGSIIGTNGGFASLGNGSLISGGTFASSNNGVVKTSPGEIGTVNGVTSTAAFHVDAGGILALQTGGFINNGTITVNPSALNAITTLRFTQDTALSGAGTLTLNANSNLSTAVIDATAPAVGTNASPHTITGSGRINAPMINSGIVRGGSPNHYLEIRNAMSQFGGRIIGEDTGSVALGNGSVITGGTFESIGDGRIRVTAGEIGTVDNVTNLGTLHVDGGGRLTVLSGGLVNNGFVTINPNTVNAITSLFAAANTTLGGTGTLVLNANSNLNTAIITTADNTQLRLTNAVTHTITGHGNVDAPIDNNGTIAGSSTSPTAVIALRNTVNQSATGRLVGNVGSVALSGATVNSGRFQGIGRVRALSGSSAINNVINETTFSLDGGAVVAVTNLTNNGTILINPDSVNAITNLSFAGVQTVVGTGTIRLASNSNLSTAILTTSSAVTLSSQQTLRGTGRLNGTFSLQGTTAPGFNDATGQIDFTGPMTFGADHILLSEASGTTVGLFDRITSSSTIALAGTLNATFVSGYNPTTPCTEFELVRANGGLSGEFGIVLLPSAPNGLKWRIAYTDTTATLRLSCRPDVNVDCIIDFFDYLDFVADFSAGDRSADYNEDDVIDFFDYLDYVADFAAGC